MKDANGRSIKVGDWVALPNTHFQSGRSVEGAVVGQVEFFVEDLLDGKVYLELGDGVSYDSGEVITLSGYRWYICQDCGLPFPEDLRQTLQPCPVCGSTNLEADIPASSEAVALLD